MLFRPASKKASVSGTVEEYMAVRIRLSRFGRIHRPFFRIVACDKRVHREGIANEILGTYDPLLGKQNIQIDVEALKSWIARGALLSESLTSLLKHAGYEVPATGAGSRKAAAKSAAGKPTKSIKGHVKATRRSLRKHAAKQKAARKATAAAAAPAAEKAAE
jgi:small subunit ribosomal protein S16